MRRAALLVAAVALVAAGCKERSPAFGLCTTIYDCKTGQACRAGLCTAGPPLPGGSFAVELVPAQGQGATSSTSDKPVLLHEEIADVVLGADDLALTFRAPVTFSGRVVVGGSTADTASIGASVSLTRRSRIGLGDEIYTIEAAAGRAGDELGFKILVPATTTAVDGDCDEVGADCYELRVVPTDLHAIPPFTRRIAVAADRLNEDLAVAGASHAMSISGTVKDAALRGVPHLAVRVVDQSGRTVSSAGTTSLPSADYDTAGLFLLTLPQLCASGERDDGCLAPGPYWVDVDAEPTEQPHAPHVLVPILIDGPDPRLGDVVLPPFTTEVVTVSYRVVGKALNGRNEPVPGGVVTISTRLGDTPVLASPLACQEACGSFTRQATTDENGEVSFVVLAPELEIGARPQARTYELQVTPGANSPYSAHVGEAEVDSMGFGPDLVLERKLQIACSLLDDAGAPVNGATVTAVARTAQEPSPALDESGLIALSIDEPPATIQSDADGNFLLMVEPDATYDITIVPSADAAAPVWVLPGQRFSQAGPLRVQLPPAALVAGTITDWSGQPVAGALVRFYQSQTDPDTRATILELRGESVSGDDGRLKVLLPTTP